MEESVSKNCDAVERAMISPDSFIKHSNGKGMKASHILRDHVLALREKLSAALTSLKSIKAGGCAAWGSQDDEVVRMLSDE